MKQRQTSGAYGQSARSNLQMQIVIQKFFVPKDKQDQGTIDQASKNLVRPLKVLDEAPEKTIIFSDKVSL